MISAVVSCQVARGGLVMFPMYVSLLTRSNRIHRHVVNLLEWTDD